MTKPYRSKAIRNIKSATNSTLRTTGNLTSKGANKVGKWLVTDHTNAIERSSMMELEQKVNFHLADAELINRRATRLNVSTQRFIDIGIQDTNFQNATGWCIDHALYVFELIWGFIWPIVRYLLMTILMILAIVVFNVIFFYGLFWLFFSNT
ncbi:MAG: hypothetical protein CTY12_06880 [Methylotenera sp.]|nr:MAG: hypothetical protein CTY14_06860 [Methylotenera sp.]PPD52211.1 MAG: hypothetical protein CTY12_06880 [Methylotenera sp.]